MMDREHGAQQKLICITMDELVPENHFLRHLERLVDFSFVYDKVESLYSRTGRRSIDPVVIVKMMLIGYLYGIDSERRLEEEVHLNVAYRWFLHIDLGEPVPDHSTISQLRRRKFNGTSLFEDIFEEVVRICIQKRLITGKLLLTDSTHVRANARNDIVEEIWVDDEPSEYIKRLNKQAEKDGLMPKRRASAEEKKTQRKLLKSPADPDCGYMRRNTKPKGFYYLDHQTCDGKHGLITDTFVTPGNATDASVHSARIQYQIDKYDFQTEAVCADAGYDFAEIHHDMLERGIKTYIPARKSKVKDDDYFSSDVFVYDSETNTLICPNNQRLYAATYRPGTGTVQYRCLTKSCSMCPLKSKCLRGKSSFREIILSYYKAATDIQHQNNGTPEYHAALRLRQIWCEGNFSHQKANHNLTRIRKRGLGKAFEHCLLSATAFNLKRMVKLLTKQFPPLISFIFEIRYAIPGRV